ncbi:Hypothetical protein A7982_11575 [Minicystis rosea]|nr:Hypothetical protein A7982_11575 [Minicystis rosea]
MHDDDPDPLTEEEEAELHKEINLAIKPYESITPPALLKQMRDRLEDGLRTHPVSRSLLRRLAPRPASDTSGEVARPGAKPDDEAGSGEEGA